VALGERLFGNGGTPRPRAPAAEVDANGFRHFRGAPPVGPGVLDDSERTAVAGIAALMRDAPDFMTGLADAIRKDLDRVARGSTP
jgi:hypothetical protein